MARNLSRGCLRAYAMVACLLAGAIVARPAHAVQASASNPIILSDQNLSVDEQITMTIRIQNTSTNDPTNSNAAAATLFGTTTVQLACTTAACTTPLPGTLEFVSCTGLAAGVPSWRLGLRGAPAGHPRGVGR